jgi:hypothetical protein
MEEQEKEPTIRRTKRPRVSPSEEGRVDPGAIGEKENEELSLEEEDDESSEEIRHAFARVNNDEIDVESDSSSDSEESSEEDENVPVFFPGMLKREKMSAGERVVLRKLKKYAGKRITVPWKKLDVLNQLMNTKFRRKCENDAQSSRTFYPAPKQFIKPFKGRTANALRDTAWYRIQSDINIMYRYIMWSLLQMEENKTEIASHMMMSVVIPFVYHLLSSCQRERLNVRYSSPVVKALYEDDTEPMIRPAHMKKAKKLAEQQKDLHTISGSFFGQGGRGRGSFRRARGSFFGPQRGRRPSWSGRRTSRSPFRQQQQQPQQQNKGRYNQFNKQKEQKN